MLSDKETIQACITKAIEGGWDMFGHRKDATPPWYVVKGGDMPTPKVVEKWVPENSLLICDYADHYFVWEHLIFNHEFLKALFGEPKIAKIRGMRVIDADGQTLSESHSFDEGNRGWQYHGTQLFLAEDRISYLRENAK